MTKADEEAFIAKYAKMLAAHPLTCRAHDAEFVAVDDATLLEFEQAARDANEELVAKLATIITDLQDQLKRANKHVSDAGWERELLWDSLERERLAGPEHMGG